MCSLKLYESKPGKGIDWNFELWTSCFEVAYCTLKYLKVLQSTVKYDEVR